MRGSRLVLPDKGETMTIENHNHKFRHPFVTFPDFEATNLPTNDDTRRAHKTNSCGCMCALVQIDTFPSGSCSFVGEDAAAQLLRQLLTIEEEALHIVNTNKPMIIIDEDFINFTKAGNCHICGTA